MSRIRRRDVPLPPDPPPVLVGARLDLVVVTVAQLLARAGEGPPAPLPYDDPDDVLHPARSPLLHRVAQVRADPTVAPWLLRLAVLRDRGTVVGLGNFHDRPDERGMVEIGYSVLPAHRGRGYGGEIARTMWTFAAGHPSVVILRASVAPDNAPSLAIVRGAGFIRVGEQDDPEDGLEWVFERPAAGFPGPAPDARTASAGR